MKLKIYLLLLIVIISGFSKKSTQKSIDASPAYSLATNISFHQYSKNPFVSQPSFSDTASLKNSSWYANAMKELEAKEYHFSSTETPTVFKNSNKKNNLSFTYHPSGFTVSSLRTEQEWKVDFNLNTQQVTNGRWFIQNEQAEYRTANVTVQYINNEAGMRQNFIVQTPLQNESELAVDFSIDSKLAVSYSKTGLQFYHNKQNVLNYDDLNVWDANQKKLEAHFQQKENNQFTIVVDTRHAVFPITIDPISSTPSNTLEQNQADAGFGFRVSSAGDVNGDGYSDVIISAPGYTNDQTNEGAAFVYYGSMNGINSSSSVLLETNQANAGLGSSVATAGDVNGDGYSDIIIGAAVYDNGQVDEGAAFIYYGSVAGINTTPTLLENNQTSANFGQSVACAGDVNGDGYSDVIVGAIKYSNGQTEEGAALIFHGSASGITTSPAIILESNSAYATMGWSVASMGDVNGDGYSDIIIGTPNYNNGQTDEGAAYIFYGSATGLKSIPELIIESNLISTQLGFSVASAGDINGDGYSDAIIGAMLYSNGQTNEGAFYIYLGSATGLSSSYTNLIESNISSAQMGWSVACAGDIDGDGYSDILVSAPGYQNGEASEGVFYLYNGSATGINSTPIIKESNQTGAVMGHSVASAGDINGDGYSDVIVGVHGFDNGEANEGVAYLYTGSINSLTSPANRVLADGLQGSAFTGYSVAGAGDVNGDGYGDVLVGSWYNDGGTITDDGRVFVYHGSATGLATTFNYYLDPTNNPISIFGRSVAGAGDVNGDGYSDVIIGSPYDPIRTNTSGLAYVYYGSSTGLNTTTYTVLADGIQADNNYGISVATAGDVNGDGYSDVVVGASDYNNGANFQEGIAFVYHGSSGGIITTPATTLQSANKAGAFFGISVSTAGDMNGDGYSDVMVGAYYYSTSFSPSVTYEGRVFVYNGSASGLSTTPSVVLQGANKVKSFFGCSVACAGDVNNDGFSDAIIGAYGNPDGLGDFEGRAFVYYGSSSGFANGAYTALSSGVASDQQFGSCVASAGDINNDGFSDVIVGARVFEDPSPTDEGKTFTYLGSSTGISTTSYFAASEANQFNAQFGFSVSTAGDVNGDGVSDLIVGVPFATSSLSRDGKTFVYYGNNKIGIRNNPILYLNDLTTIYNSNTGTNQTTFGIGLYSKSFLGRTKGKIAWETKLNYNPFNGSPVTNSTFYTAQQNSFTDLGTTGVELKNVVDKILTLHSFTKIRVRTKYDPVTAITGQMYGPWRYIQDNLTGSWLGALPVELNSFSASWIEKGKSSEIAFSVSNENNMCCYDIEKSTDGIRFNKIGTLQATNQTAQHHYFYTDNNTTEAKIYYRLKMQARDGQIKYSDIVTLKNSTGSISVAPNPTKNSIRFSFTNPVKNTQWEIIDSEGKLVLAGRLPNQNYLLVNVQPLAKGTYTFRIISQKENSSVLFIKE